MHRLKNYNLAVMITLYFIFKLYLKIKFNLNFKILAEKLTFFKIKYD